MTAQQWIARALLGFFRHEGQTLTEEQKHALTAQMALAAVGIQGNLDIRGFEVEIFGEAAPCLRSRH